MMKIGIIRKPMTSNERTFLWKHFAALCEYLKINFMVSELDYGLENRCSRKRTPRTTQI